MSGGHEHPQAAPPLPPEKSGQGAPERLFLTLTLEEVVRPLGIAGMLTCLALSLSQFIHSLAPHWPTGFFTILAWLISLEGIVSWRAIVRLRLSGKDKTRFRFVEWVVLLVIIRLGVSLQEGWAGLVSDARSWTESAGSFFEIQFLLISFFLFIVWFIALGVAQTMQELEASETEKAPPTTDPRYDLWVTAPARGRLDRQAKLRGLVNSFFGGGVVLLILTGLSLINLRDLLALDHPRSPGIILNVLIYFVIGFLLISQAHYTILKANWELQSIPVLGRLGRRWLLLVIGFLAIVGLVAALLPVDYSVNIIDVLSTIFWWIIHLILQIVGLILFVISYAVGWIASLFGGKSSDVAPPTMPPPAFSPPPPVETVERQPAAWWQFARSLLFWFALTGVIGYSLYHFIGDRWSIFRQISMLPLLRWVGRLLRGLRLGAREATGRLREMVVQGLARRRRQVVRRAARYLALRGMNSRERVLYFYVSILHRAAGQGFGRAASMTPLEYQRTLADQMPDEELDVEALTQAFLEARYSAHAIPEEQMRSAQSVWQRIKRALALRRRRLETRQPPPDADAPPVGPHAR